MSHLSVTRPPATRPLTVVGLSGNITSPSKTRVLVETTLALIADRTGAATEVFEVEDFGPELGTARSLDGLSADARAKIARIVAADALVVATPTYKASYPGLFKHLIDLFDPLSLRRKPVLIAATGGGEKHALAVEHQLRPLFAFFEARVLSTAVHVSDRDFENYILTGPAALERLNRAVTEFDDVFPHLHQRPHAAE